jgi:hypothetical protein
VHKSVFIWVGDAGILVVDGRLSAGLRDGGGQVASSLLLLHLLLVFFVIRNVKVGLERFEEVASGEGDAVEAFLIIALILNNFRFADSTFLRLDESQSLLNRSPRLLCRWLWR